MAGMIAVILDYNYGSSHTENIKEFDVIVDAYIQARNARNGRMLNRYHGFVQGMIELATSKSQSNKDQHAKFVKHAAERMFRAENATNVMFDLQIRKLQKIYNNSGG